LRWANPQLAVTEAYLEDCLDDGALEWQEEGSGAPREVSRGGGDPWGNIWFSFTRGSPGRPVDGSWGFIYSTGPNGKDESSRGDDIAIPDPPPWITATFIHWSQEILFAAGICLWVFGLSPVYWPRSQHQKRSQKQRQPRSVVNRILMGNGSRPGKQNKRRRFPLRRALFVCALALLALYVGLRSYWVSSHLQDITFIRSAFREWETRYVLELPLVVAGTLTATALIVALAVGLTRSRTVATEVESSC
jgi:hypothetical protein